MIRRNLRIGRWLVYFFFVTERYDIDTIMSYLETFDCPPEDMARAENIMKQGKLNKAFTYTNPYLRRAIMVIGPTSSGAEFQDSLSHEIRHLADKIALSIGIRLDAEEPAYMTGDTVRELAAVVCELGCDRCRGEEP